MYAAVRRCWNMVLLTQSTYFTLGWTWEFTGSEGKSVRCRSGRPFRRARLVSHVLYFTLYFVLFAPT